MDASRTRLVVFAWALAFLLAAIPLASQRAWADDDLAAGDAAGLQAQATTIASGMAGTCPWELDSDGVLTVHPGDYARPSSSSFFATGGYDNAVKRVVFKEENGKRVVVGSSRTSSLSIRFPNMTSVDLSGLDTSAATSMDGMFSGCSSLTAFDLSGADTSKVNYIANMFLRCSSLRLIDLSTFDMSSTPDTTWIAGNCEKLRTIKLPKGMNPGNLPGVAWKGPKGTVLAADDFGTGYLPMTMYGTWTMVVNLSDPGWHASIDLSAYGNEAVFNGTHYEPAVGEVYGYGKVYDPAVLAEGEECELTYENNVNAGTAKVVITGVGNAKGKMVKEFTIKPASIKDELIVLSRSAFAYNGKVQRPEVKSIGGKALKEDADYTLMCSNASSTQVGTYTVLVVGKGNYEGTSSGATYEIVKASQSIKASNCSAVAKAKKAGKTRALAKKATVNLKAKAKVSAKTAVKYAKVGKAGGSKIAVNAKTGKVTLKKGLKAGTYKLKVKLTAAADANYKAAKVKTITLAVKVK